MQLAESAPTVQMKQQVANSRCLLNVERLSRQLLKLDLRIVQSPIADCQVSLEYLGRGYVSS